MRKAREDGVLEGDRDENGFQRALFLFSDFFDIQPSMHFEVTLKQQLHIL